MNKGCVTRTQYFNWQINECIYEASIVCSDSITSPVKLKIAKVNAGRVTDHRNLDFGTYEEALSFLTTYQDLEHKDAKEAVLKQSQYLAQQEGTYEQNLKLWKETADSLKEKLNIAEDIIKKKDAEIQQALEEYNAHCDNERILYRTILYMARRIKGNANLTVIEIEEIFLNKARKAYAYYKEHGVNPKYEDEN